MPTLDLSPFCFPQEWDDMPERLAQLGTPFSFKQWTIATDGRILVAVPRRPEVAERELPPHMLLTIGSYLSMNSAQGSPVAVASLQFPRAWWFRTCSTCNGTGRRTYPEDGQPVTMACPVCDGDGKEWEEPQAVQFRRHQVSHLYLSRLALLPECRLWDAPLGDPLPFEFAGGIGRLCTLKQR